jgi:predicted metal-dependent hydrolase
MTGSLQAIANREQIEINWGNRLNLAELHRSQRRILRIEVQSSGEVVVFAPFGEPSDKVRDRVKRRGAWIFREIDRVANRPSITPERRYISGETHLFLGRQYRLSIEKSENPQVRIEGTRMHVLVPHEDDQVYCKRIIESLYAITARSVFSDRLDAMFPPFSRKGMGRPTLIVRRMSKRWGSYTRRGRIVLNVDLVRASPMLIDYVICHELTHAFHQDHGKEWRSLLSTIMPDWEDRKNSLEYLLR